MSALHPTIMRMLSEFTLDDGARGIVEMLFSTSLVALVGAADQPESSPRKLQIVNTKVSVASFTTLFSARSISILFSAGIRNLRAVVPVVHPRCKAQQSNFGRRA